MTTTMIQLTDVVADIPPLRGLFITAMPDCLLFDTWMRPDETWSAEAAASYFGDLVRANREALKALAAWSAELSITVESADLLLLMYETSTDFVVTMAFDRKAPLGMVRLHARRILDRLQHVLPKLDAVDRPRAFRIAEFLDKYAPDPHAARHRIALRTGMTLDELHDPAGLNAAQTELLEVAVKDLLGLDNLAI
jgi:predicted regulator of Ras-like GTPase activity (Roadblock/LC7/MglB family)